MLRTSQKGVIFLAETVSVLIYPHKGYEEPSLRLFHQLREQKEETGVCFRHAGVGQSADRPPPPLPQIPSTLPSIPRVRYIMNRYSSIL